MSDSSRIRVSIVPEVTFGVTPATPAFLSLPITGHSMKDRIGYTKSNIISPSRGTRDLARLSKSAGGGIPCELAYSPSGEGLNAAIAAMLCSTFTAATTQVTGVTGQAGSPTADLDATGVGTGIEVGDIVRVLTSLDVLVGYFRVAARSNDSISVYDPDGEITNTVNLKVLRGARCKNGTTKTSFSVEVAYLDLQIAQLFKGQVFNQADLNVAIGQLATMAFSLEGKDSETINSNTGTPDQFVAGATYAAATSHPTLSPIDVQEVQVGAANYAASSVAMTWNNNARPSEQLGNLGPVRISLGMFDASGRIAAYHDGLTDHDRFANNTETDVWKNLIDANGRGYSISYPRIKFSDVESPVQSNNSDVFKNVAVTALEDQTELCTVRWQRWGD